MNWSTRSHCLLATLLTLTTLALSPATAQTDPAASKATYDDIHARLDPGGDLMVIANVEGLIEKAVEAAQQMAALAPATPGSPATGAETIAKAAAFLKRNGFYAIKGLGLSIVPRRDGMSTMKTFIARDPEAARLPLWMAMVGGAPSAMNVHAYLPKDAVLVRSGTADLQALWTLVKSGITDVGGQEAASGFNMGLQMFASQMGITVDALIESLVPEGAISVQLSTTETVTIPLDGTTTTTIPAPSLLLVTAVKDSTIIDTIKKAFMQQLEMPLPEVRMGEATVYNVPVPIPAPVPMQLTLATHGNYLLIGSTSAVVTDAINAATSGNGLKSVPEFAKAYPSSRPNNGIQFASRRLGQALKSMRDQMFRQMPTGSEEAAAFKMFQGWMDQNLDTGAAFTIYNYRTGVQIGGVSASGGKQAVGAMMAAPMGMMAAIAIPSFVKARTQSQKNACINNLRQIDSAKEQWALEQNKRNGDIADEAGIAAYIKGNAIPTCPQGGTYTIGPIGTDPTCSHPGHSL